MRPTTATTTHTPIRSNHRPPTSRNRTRRSSSSSNNDYSAVPTCSSSVSVSEHPSFIVALDEVDTAEDADCLMIRVCDDDDDDNDEQQQEEQQVEDEEDDHQSFVTARASLSAASPRNNDNDNAEDLRTIVVRSSSSSNSIPWYHRQWFGSDDSEGGEASWQIKHLTLVEGPAFVRFAKFVLVSFASIWIMYYVVRFLNWEHDPTLRLRDLWRYEGNLIFTDSLFYFIVGRLYRQRGIDHFQWLAILAASMFYSSAVTNFRMFQHAFTLYEMHCRWPWQLWLFVALAVPVIVAVAVAHFRYAYRRGWLIQKFLEVTFCLTFLLFPLVTSSYFHLHHWFAGFLVGMHCNYDLWWSRATLAWCWGAYLNGIAVYGRDPVLTCEYALFLAVTQRCPFVDCYIDAMNRNFTDDPTNATVQEMKHPDWRNCSADAYHP